MYLKIDEFMQTPTQMKNNILKLGFLIIFCLSVASSLPNISYAQISTSISNISIDMSPSNPQSFEQVSLKVVSFNIDVNRASISWFINGELILSGIGETRLSFKTGDVGSVSNVDININPVGLTPINKSITITPAEVDMLWEAINSYTPPFYKGKALPASESLIKITAFPNIVNTQGVKPNPSDMVYGWKRNYKFEEFFNKQSGYGKQSVLFRKKLIGDDTFISVSASSLDGKISSIGKLTLEDYSPEIIFYKKSPVEGILYNNALLNNLKIEEKEIDIVAEPYFFSMLNGIDTLNYDWSIDRKKIDAEERESENQNEIILRTSEGNGSANISLKIRNIERLLQFISRSFNIEF